MLFSWGRRFRSSQFPPDPIRGPLMRDLAGDEMPESLTPKLDSKQTKVFDDEVDPAWRDPNTTE